jgi:hypothetical protein
LRSTASASISIWIFSLTMTPPGIGALKPGRRGAGGRERHRRVVRGVQEALRAQVLVALLVARIDRGRVDDPVNVSRATALISDCAEGWTADYRSNLQH